MENAIEKRPRSWIVGWVVGILISLAALVVAFWGVQPGRFLNKIAQANYVYLIPSALLLLLGLLARARSWQVLLGDQVGFGRAFSALNEGYLLNNMLPLRLGELGRAYMVSQGQPIGSAKALATVVMERIIDVVVSLAGLLLALPFVVAPQWARDVAWAAGGVLVAVVFLLAMLL
ncbi:MAG: lysylphosphatidylglycerol synthase transmembrane domain-containing protein, partial [Anaerolineales bacterium]